MAPGSVAGRASGGFHPGVAPSPTAPPPLPRLPSRLLDRGYKQAPTLLRRVEAMLPSPFLPPRLWEALSSAPTGLAQNEANARAQTTVDACRDTGAVSSGEGRMGSLKRINSLELFDFSFDEEADREKRGRCCGAFSDQEIPYI